MSIKPVDIQSLFAKMNEVSKEQSLQKESVALQQSQTARNQISKELADDRRVTHSLEENRLNSIKDDEAGRQEQDSRQKREDNSQKPETEQDRIVVKDQDIGRHIDLTG
ncbi:MAG: hypothetical protein B0D92_00910 [Spirochaeta sp. LUC14_002_19_P3]|nr:MAG: hypothetical protein B0D92_00910 [Spirochaeta sp. LUC14_002_19_P3]